VFVCEREGECVRVLGCERDRVCVCVRESKIERVCVCVCVCNTRVDIVMFLKQIMLEEEVVEFI